MFRIQFIILVVCTLSSCVSTKYNGYAPVDENYFVMNRYHIEGSLSPSYSYSYIKKIEEEGQISIQIIKNQGLWFSLTIGLERDTYFQLTSSIVRITDIKNIYLYDLNINKFIQPITGENGQPGYLRSLNTTSILKGNDDNTSSVFSAKMNNIKSYLPECILIHLPEMKINNKLIQISPIKFVKMIDGIYIPKLCN